MKKIYELENIMNFFNLGYVYTDLREQKNKIIELTKKLKEKDKNIKENKGVYISVNELTEIENDIRFYTERLSENTFRIDGIIRIIRGSYDQSGFEENVSKARDHIKIDNYKISGMNSNDDYTHLIVLYDEIK